MERQRANDAQKAETHLQRKDVEEKQKKKGGQGLDGDLVETVLRWP